MSTYENNAKNEPETSNSASIQIHSVAGSSEIELWTD